MVLHANLISFSDNERSIVEAYVIGEFDQKGSKSILMTNCFYYAALFNSQLSFIIIMLFNSFLTCYHSRRKSDVDYTDIQYVKMIIK